jgi:putative oxidoreductase
MTNLALLVLRLTVGGLLAGHGAQKLFGAFGGPGLRGTAEMLESMGTRPGRVWAPLAGAAEFGGGVLTALGLLHPLGPLGILAAMTVATAKAHRGKPIWVTAGGAELPVTNIAVAAALALAGAGRYSIDTALGVRLPARAAALATGAVAAGVAASLAPAGALDAIADRLGLPAADVADRVRRAAGA